jgi:CheY-like chemotaxis protein
MSHEIRTPMTAILGYADMTLEESLSLAAREHVDVIKRNGQHLLGLINDILDLSKIEAGKMEFARVRCSPAELLSEVAALMQVRADAKRLRLTTELTGPIPETMLTDPLRFRQVLVNLVGNAIKFTDHGDVQVTAQLVNSSSGPQLCVRVRDTGIGMSRDEVRRLFHAFTQVDNSAARKFGGSGMGLCISKYLAEALGGTITVRSVPDRGSIFTLTIDPGPLTGVPMFHGRLDAAVKRQADAAVNPEPSAALTGRVLLVEDGSDNRRLISLLLRKAGASVVAVEDGRVALGTALAAKEIGEPYDVILMDMQMPVMDGYTATRRLRDAGYDGPIVALTAHAMDQECQRCLEAGCDDYATKPVDRPKLLAMVAHWIGRHRANRQDAAATERLALSEDGR